jgi:hypothetical protein
MLKSSQLIVVHTVALQVAGSFKDDVKAQLKVRYSVIKEP